MRDLVKELQNLYSWNEFYTTRSMRKESSNAQSQIKDKKKEISEFKRVLNERKTKKK